MFCRVFTIKKDSEATYCDFKPVVDRCSLLGEETDHLIDVARELLLVQLDKLCLFWVVAAEWNSDHFSFFLSLAAKQGQSRILIN